MAPIKQLPEKLLALDHIPPPTGAIEKIYAVMLYGAMRNLSPEVVIELGTGSGYSTAWMLLGLEENQRGHLWSCDLVASDIPIWQQLQLPTQRLTYFSNDPVESLENKLPPEFDFVFHDAGHSTAEVFKDLGWLLPRLKLQGRLVIHDTIYSKDMGVALLKTLEDLKDNFKYETIEEGCGVMIVTCIKKLEKEQCKDVLSGSMTQKDSDSLKVKMAKTTLLTSRKSKTKMVVVPSQKIRPSISLPPSNKKVPERRRLLSDVG